MPVSASSVVSYNNQLCLPTIMGRMDCRLGPCPDGLCAEALSAGLRDFSVRSSAEAGLSL